MDGVVIQVKSLRKGPYKGRQERATAVIIYDADPDDLTRDLDRRRRYEVWEGAGRHMSVTRVGDESDRQYLIVEV